jgi:hypothetical protein
MAFFFARTAQRGRLAQRLVEARRFHAEWRDHDVVLSDPRAAAEHFQADLLATSRGDAGCPFCQS